MMNRRKTTSTAASFAQDLGMTEEQWNERMTKFKSRGPIKPIAGVYKGLPFEDYIRIEAINRSKLDLVGQSLRHYRYGTEPLQGDHIKIGNLFHHGQLEVDRFDEMYAVMPSFHLDALNVTKDGKSTESKVTNYYKERVAQFVENNPRKTVVPEEWFNKMKKTLSAITGNPEAKKCFSVGDPEVTLVWQDPTTELFLKARVDFANTKHNRLVDLKTTKDVLKFNLSDFGYHRQAAMYSDGWEILTGEKWEFWFVPVEKIQPHSVRAAKASDKAVEIGRSEYQYFLKEIVSATQKRKWPGPPNPKSWVMGKWYESKVTDTRTSSKRRVPDARKRRV